ncbi:MAG: VF530 family protein [Chromatiaceae bacterium]|nr:VF530 family protein [Chromatiaceae bacterium]
MPWDSVRDAGAGDPLHGVTLQMMLTRLLDRYGWEELGRRIRIKCFISDPSIASSLKFLRRTPWARAEVEALYLDTHWPVPNVWHKSRHDSAG